MEVTTRIPFYPEIYDFIDILQTPHSILNVVEGENA